MKVSNQLYYVATLPQVPQTEGQVDCRSGLDMA